jgi:dimethylsulfone monooxygenase
MGSTLQRSRDELYSKNALKLGMFGPNLSSGLAATKVPERWSGSWADNLALASMIDAAGIEFVLPVARWKGYGGATNFEGEGFETITWASGLLSATKTLTAFGTVHTPLIHPVFAAKQFVTVDHLSLGRFGLNVVCGWNQDEFAMFGAQQREHDVRYGYGKEWLSIVKGIWNGTEPFDFDGDFFSLQGVVGGPRPHENTRPVIMNAGSSATGVTFAIENCDHLFVAIRDRIDAAAEVVTDVVQRAKALGKDHLGVFGIGNVVCRPTVREAEEYYHYFADEQADWEAVDHMFGIGTANPPAPQRLEIYKKMRVRYAAGYGGWPLVGDPDTVAAGLMEMSRAGFTGVALGFVNYLAEFPYFRDEVLPRLERAGAREPLLRRLDR